MEVAKLVQRGRRRVKSPTDLKRGKVSRKYPLPGGRITGRDVTLTSAGLIALQQHQLTKFQSSVLWWLVATLPDEGEQLSMKKLQLEFNSTGRWITQTFKVLVNAKFLLRDETASWLAKGYKLNPRYFVIAK